MSAENNVSISKIENQEKSPTCKAQQIEMESF